MELGKKLAEGEFYLEGFVGNQNPVSCDDVKLFLVDSEGTDPECIADVSLTLRLVKAIDSAEGEALGLYTLFADMSNLVTASMTMECLQPIPDGLLSAVQALPTGQLTLSASLNLRKLDHETNDVQTIQIKGGITSDDGVVRWPRPRKGLIQLTELQVVILS